MANVARSLTMQRLQGLAHARLVRCVLHLLLQRPDDGQAPPHSAPERQHRTALRILELGGERDVDGKCDKHDPDDAGLTR